LKELQSRNNYIAYAIVIKQMAWFRKAVVGLYNISPEKSIVEECISDTDTCQSPVDKKVTWVEIVKRNKKK